MDQLFDAVILAGGQGSRLGGVDKAAVELDGASLVSRSFKAAAKAKTVVVVGETTADIPANAIVTQEDPPGSGPAAALLAGLKQLTGDAPWVLVLACDLPGAASAVTRLARILDRQIRADLDSDGVVLTDPAGTPQWVLGIYRRESLDKAAQALGDARNVSMRALLGDLDLTMVAPRGEEWHDVDTWDDHALWARSCAALAQRGELKAEWATWIAAATSALDIPMEQVDLTVLHELAQDVTTGTSKNLVPVASYLLGLAVGRMTAQGQVVDVHMRREIAAKIPHVAPR